MLVLLLYLLNATIGKKTSRFKEDNGDKFGMINLIIKAKRILMPTSPRKWK